MKARIISKISNINNIIQPQTKVWKIIIILKIVLDIEAGIVIVQELFIGNWDISHNRFNFYQL